MIHKLEGMKTFETVNPYEYAIELLNLTKNLHLKFGNQICINDNIFMFLLRLFNYKNNPDYDLVKQKDKLNNRFNIVEQFGYLENSDILYQANPESSSSNRMRL